MIFHWRSQLSVEIPIGRPVVGLRRNNQRPESVEFTKDDFEQALKMAREDSYKLRKYLVHRVAATVHDNSSVIALLKALNAQLAKDEL